MGYSLRYEYGISKQSIQDGWQRERPDNGIVIGEKTDGTVKLRANCGVERDARAAMMRAWKLLGYDLQILM